MKNLKKILCLSLALILLLPSLGLAASNDYGKAKNVILLMPDGMSIEAATSARWMTDSFSFSFDDMATGLVRTNNSNTPIADSAPAGTAMATGYKTESPFIGTYPTKASMPGAKDFDPAKSMMPLANV